jgi:hypothetical protein
MRIAPTKSAGAVRPGSLEISARSSRNSSRSFCAVSKWRRGAVREFMIVRIHDDKISSNFYLEEGFPDFRGKPILERYPYSPFNGIVSVRSILSYSAVA